MPLPGDTHHHTLFILLSLAELVALCGGWACSQIVTSTQPSELAVAWLSVCPQVTPEFRLYDVLWPPSRGRYDRDKMFSNPP